MTTQHLVRRRTGRLAVVTSVLVTWVVLAAAGTAHASPPPEDRKRDVEAHLDEAEHELHHSSAAVQKAAAALKRTAVELPKAQARLADARAIDCAEVDLAVLRGEREPDLTLFAA